MAAGIPVGNVGFLFASCPTVRRGTESKTTGHRPLVFDFRALMARPNHAPSPWLLVRMLPPGWDTRGAAENVDD